MQINQISYLYLLLLFFFTILDTAARRLLYRVFFPSGCAIYDCDGSDLSGDACLLNPSGFA